MAVDLRVATQALFTAVLLTGSLSSGLPVPQDASVVMPHLEATPVQQANAGGEMAQELQKVGDASTSQTSSNPPMMIETPEIETPVMMPMDAAPISAEPQQVVDASVMPVVQQEPQQPAEAGKSRPDCPEMNEENIKVVLTCEDKPDDKFHIMAASSKEPAPTPEAPITSQ
uniref:Obscurin n=1 Tax=Lygus hesperus TaxID=30085 RepID=A0A0A9Y7S0_LYGHE